MSDEDKVVYLFKNRTVNERVLPNEYNKVDPKLKDHKWQSLTQRLNTTSIPGDITLSTIMEWLFDMDVDQILPFRDPRMDVAHPIHGFVYYLCDTFARYMNTSRWYRFHDRNWLIANKDPELDDGYYFQLRFGIGVYLDAYIVDRKTVSIPESGTSVSEVRCVMASNNKFQEEQRKEIIHPIIINAILHEFCKDAAVSTTSLDYASGSVKPLVLPRLTFTQPFKHGYDVLWSFLSILKSMTSRF